jgi:Sigma-70, region 4
MPEFDEDAYYGDAAELRAAIGAERAKRWWAYRDWSAEWKERRALGLKRRDEWVQRRLKEPVNFPIELERVLTEEAQSVAGHRFTPKQLEALTYRYGFGLSLREAADALGIDRSTFRRRLERADANLERWYGLERPDHTDPGWEREVEERRLEFEAERSEWRRHGPPMGVD